MQFPCSIFDILLVFLRFLISCHAETSIFRCSENPQAGREVKNLSSSAVCDPVKCFSPATPEHLIPLAACSSESTCPKFFCSSRAVSQIMAVFEEGFTMCLQQMNIKSFQGAL